MESSGLELSYAVKLLWINSEASVADPRDTQGKIHQLKP